jgi:hypothetical protein
MIEIIVYSTIDGMIFKSVTCKEEDASLQCGPDQAWMEHKPVDDSLYKVDLNTLDIIPIE